MADARRPEFNSDQLAEVRRLQGLYPDKRGALLPVLRLAQETFGYVSLEVEEYVNRHRNERDPAGHAVVVRNGTARPRSVTTGVGPIPVAAPS